MQIARRPPPRPSSPAHNGLTGDSHGISDWLAMLALSSLPPSPSPSMVFPRPLPQPMVLISSSHRKREPKPLNRCSSPMHVLLGSLSVLTAIYLFTLLSHFSSQTGDFAARLLLSRCASRGLS